MNNKQPTSHVDIYNASGNGISFKREYLEELQKRLTLTKDFLNEIGIDLKMIVIEPFAPSEKWRSLDS